MPTDHDYILHTVKLAKAAGEASYIPIGVAIV